MPYDSNQGRDLAGLLVSFLSVIAFDESANMAQELGSFPGFEKNKSEMLKVVKQHLKAAEDFFNKKNATLPISFLIDGKEGATDVEKRIKCRGLYLQNILVSKWGAVLKKGNEFGFRNAQVSLIAPTGTIGLIMDCESLGIEPEFALVKTKNFVGGKKSVMISKSFEIALQKLGYSNDIRKKIIDFVLKNGDLAGCPEIRSEHKKVFQTSHEISSDGHLQMMAAVQPFLSGAISKTVNVKSSTTKTEISNIFKRAWKLKLKSISVYRDNSKLNQPLKKGVST